jgi:Na+/proline symporter
VRTEAVDIVKQVSGDRAYNDINYVFPTFVLTQLPVGLVGLLIAAIMVAAMTASSAELAALSTASVIDFYRRWFAPNASDRQLLVFSRVAVGFWGAFASVVAIYASELGSLIEVVNRFGSYFYGSILGVFILAIGAPRANGHGAFVGLLAGMTAVWYVATQTTVEFLWLNLVGAVAVYVAGSIVSAVTGGARTARA